MSECVYECMYECVLSNQPAVAAGGWRDQVTFGCWLLPVGC